MDVVAADPDVAEGPPSAANSHRREPYADEGPKEPREQVEEDGLVPGRGLVGTSGYGNDVLGRLPGRAERLGGRRPVPRFLAPAAPHADELSDRHGPRCRDRDRGE